MARYKVTEKCKGKQRYFQSSHTVEGKEKAQVLTDSRKCSLKARVGFATKLKILKS